MMLLQHEKQDIERQILEFKRNEQELEKMKEIENLRTLQLKLFKERKELFALVEKKRHELDQVKKNYYSELS